MLRAFEVFDEEGKGFVSLDDLGRVVHETTGSKLPTAETRAMVNASLQDGSLSASLGGLSLSDFSSMFAGLKHKHYPRGHVIFEAGDEGDAMYFLNSGKVEIRTKKGKLVSILRPGDFFGEGSLLNEEKARFTTARCATPVDVLRIKQRDFERYINSSESAKTALKVKWKARSLHYAKNLIRLHANVQSTCLKKGDVVYQQGDVGKSMFIVDEGHLQVTHEDGVVMHNYHKGDTFGESSLLFARPRSSTVTCVSDICHLSEMRGKDFMALVDSSPEMAASLRNMCRKRLFKKAVKSLCLKNTRGLSEDDLVAAFYAADVDKSGKLSLEEIRALVQKMEPNFTDEDARALLKFIDVDQDGYCSLEEFKRLFRVFLHTK